MKKIMFALAAVAMAVGAHAAQFEWGATNIREGWDNPDTRATGTAYLFLVSSSLTEAGIASDIAGATDATALATTLAGKAIDTQAVSSGATGGLTAEGIAATAPAKLFFVAISDDGHVYQSSALTIDTIEALGSTAATFGSQKSASSAASAWADKSGGGSTPTIPEPTSGLLMLVGLGALALRRKR